jgi:hypothetical protein
MNRRLRSLLCALPALAGFADAQIDSGGGKAMVGGLSNHASNGGIVARDPGSLGSRTQRSGLIWIPCLGAGCDGLDARIAEMSHRPTPDRRRRHSRNLPAEFQRRNRNSVFFQHSARRKGFFVNPINEAKLIRDATILKRYRWCSDHVVQEILCHGREYGEGITRENITDYLVKPQAKEVPNAFNPICKK